MADLGDLLYGKNADGTPRFAADDVAYAMPFLIFGLQQDPSALPKVVQDSFLRGLEMCGCSGDDDVDKLSTNLATAYGNKPPSEALVGAVTAWAREQLQNATTPDGARSRLEAFVGTATSSGVLGGGERPKGTVPAGPLARFAMPPSSPKK